MDKLLKRLSLIFFDTITCIISIYASFYIILGPHYSWSDMHAGAFYEYILGAVVVMIIINFVFGLYTINWMYASIREMLRVAFSAVAYNISLFMISRLFYPAKFIEIRIFLIYAVLTVMFIMTLRISYRVISYLKAEFMRINGEGGRILIIGAGDIGRLLLVEINNNPERGMVVGFIDDDYIKGTSIKGIKVIDNIDSIIETAENLEIDEIIVALPQSESDTIKKALNLCTRTVCKIFIMPDIHKLSDTFDTMSKLRNVEPEDLLGRPPVDLNVDDISDYIRNHVVLVTGGGGSIGSELSRQIAGYSPKQLILVDIYENNVHDLQRELEPRFKDLNLEVIIASVRDIKRLDVIFNKYKPDIVFHAAAHKHVPMMEFSPGEAVKNNVFGTRNVAIMADKHNVQRFVMISTDKAVNPTNVMGATKRIAEKIIGCMNNISETRFVAVRFGNVLGSNGSVIPLFKKQIEAGGPVTITHPDMMRYFMTIPEAAQLVLQAGGLSDQGTMFILDMGEMVRILDLARNLIKLSGLTPDKDIKIVNIGLRPGEKMYEELLTNKEELEKTIYEKIYIGEAEIYNDVLVNKHLEEMKTFLDIDDEAVINMIKIMVPEFIETEDTDNDISDTDDIIEIEADVVDDIAIEGTDVNIETA